MIDPYKLQCFTTAAWLRGYAAQLNGYKDEQLLHKLIQAALLLEYVVGQDSEKQEDRNEPPWKY